MSKYYIDAGTTYSKIIETGSADTTIVLKPYLVKEQNGKKYYILPSKMLKTINFQFEKACGHMSGTTEHENEIIALAKGCSKIIMDEATILDLGSRDAKWIKYKQGKFSDMDWNTSCASSTGATVEMLLKFYDVDVNDLSFNIQRFPVTCGIFGLEKIMDDISKGNEANEAISKFIHGIAYNAWSFSKKPPKIYLSGGFCQNECFIKSLENYCKVEILGRFVLCEGLIDA